MDTRAYVRARARTGCCFPLRLVRGSLSAERARGRTARESGMDRDRQAVMRKVCAHMGREHGVL